MSHPQATCKWTSGWHPLVEYEGPPPSLAEMSKDRLCHPLRRPLVSGLEEGLAAAGGRAGRLEQLSSGQARGLCPQQRQPIATPSCHHSMLGPVLGPDPHCKAGGLPSTAARLPSPGPAVCSLLFPPLPACLSASLPASPHCLSLGSFSISVSPCLSVSV